MYYVVDRTLHSRTRKVFKIILSLNRSCIFVTKLIFSVAVTQLAWYDEDKRFGIAFSDGLIYMATKEEFEEPIIVEAHQVNTCAHIAGIVRFTLIKLHVIPHILLFRTSLSRSCFLPHLISSLSNGVLTLAGTETGTGTRNK